MTGTGTGDDRRKRILKALAGLAAFAGFGLLLAPGFAKRDPAPPPSSAPGGPPAQRPAASDDGNALLGIQLDDFTGPGRRTVETGSGPERAFDCMIVPNEVVAVGSALTGLIGEVTVERGDYVEAGQVVARLEASVEEAALRVAEARAERTDAIESGRTNLALSRQRLERAKELFDRDVLSLDTRDEVQAKADLAALDLKRAREDHRQAALQLEQARANLERRTIRSPVAGVVVERSLSPGEVVDQDTIVHVARIDPLRVDAILPADWFGRMKSGDAAQVVPEAPLDQPREAAVAIVDPVLDGASGTFGVQLDLPNPDKALPAGLRCQVRFGGGGAQLAALDPAGLTPESPEPPPTLDEPVEPAPASEVSAEAMEPPEAAEAPAEVSATRPELPPSLGGFRWEPLEDVGDSVEPPVSAPE